MAQFIAYENKNRSTRKTYPYVLDIQSNLLDGLRTAVVIPLCHAKFLSAPPITKLCPVVKINDEDYIALTQQMAGIDKKLLGNEVCSLSSYRAEIITAFDFVISGI